MLKRRDSGKDLRRLPGVIGSCQFDFRNGKVSEEDEPAEEAGRMPGEEVCRCAGMGSMGARGSLLLLRRNRKFGNPRYCSGAGRTRKTKRVDHSKKVVDVYPGWVDAVGLPGMSCQART